MILVSCQRWPPAAIAELLGYDPATVRRWIDCEDVAEVLAPPV
jgi:hypothetical protein